MISIEQVMIGDHISYLLSFPYYSHEYVGSKLKEDIDLWRNQTIINDSLLLAIGFAIDTYYYTNKAPLNSIITFSNPIERCLIYESIINPDFAAAIWLPNGYKQYIVQVLQIVLDVINENSTEWLNDVINVLAGRSGVARYYIDENRGLMVLGEPSLSRLLELSDYKIDTRRSTRNLKAWDDSFDYEDWQRKMDALVRGEQKDISISIIQPNPIVAAVDFGEGSVLIDIDSVNKDINHEN